MIAISDDELNKLHLLTLNMAEQFVHFCRQNNLICYLCGGGCIGAVRHKGWIPWDDDLDFFMPREDYEKAIIYWKQQMAHSRYKMEISDAEHIDGNLFFTIRDSATTYIKPYQENMNITQGIVLDVLPLDGYPDKWWNRKKQCFWALIYSLYCAQITPKNHGKIIETLAKIMLFLVPNKKKRYKIFSYAKQKMTKYPMTKRYRYDDIGGNRRRWNFLFNYPAGYISFIAYLLWDWNAKRSDIRCDTFSSNKRRRNK